MRVPEYVFIVKCGQESLGFFDLIDAHQWMRQKWGSLATRMLQFYEIVELLEKTGTATITDDIEIIRIPMAKPSRLIL